MDMAAGVTLPDGMLKQMSEGTLTRAERKNRESITFTLRAVPLLVGNNVPRLNDRSQGFKRRLCVMPFDRSFTTEEQDPSLFQRIVEAEMSGVLNRALAGLQRVIQRGWKLDLPKDVKAATEAWWAEATGHRQALTPPELRGSRVTRTTTQDGSDASSPRAALILPPERLAASQQVAAATAVKVKVDLASSGTLQTVEVEATHQSVTVRVGPQV